jgi:hypothetical protein
MQDLQFRQLLAQLPLYQDFQQRYNNDKVLLNLGEVYLMGTGVGEAMLIGAAVGATAGGAGAAIQGGDPLKGALTGGAMGAVGGGLGAGFGAAGGTAAGGASGATAGGTSGAVAGGTSGAAAGAAGGAGTGATFGSLGAGTTGSAVGSLSPTVTSLAPSTFGSLAAPTAGTTFGSLAAPTAGITSLAVPTGSALAGTGAGAVGGTGGALAGNFTGFAPALSNTGLATIGGTSLLGSMMQAERDRFGVPGEEDYVSTFDPSKFRRSEPTYAPESVYRPEYRDYTTAAEGGIMRLANGGPVERMSQMNTAMNPQGGLYPQGMIDKTQYATPTQRPVSAELMMDAPAYERSNPMLMNEGGIAQVLESAKAQGLSPEMYQNIYGRGNAIIEMEKRLKEGKSMASGGISSLGGYSDGGRMLKGPGDGMSDSIPGVIAGKQPARLADGEFVVPADVVSHLGNGSTDAGAKQLYAMMDKVRKARTGKKKQAPAVKANRYMPV